jgi:hypothetical protein
MKILKFKNVSFELGKKLGSFIALPTNEIGLTFNQISVTPNYFFSDNYLLKIGVFKKEFKTLKELKDYCNSVSIIFEKTETNYTKCILK